MPFDFSNASKDIKELMCISKDSYPGEISYFVENTHNLPLKKSLSMALSNVSLFYRLIKSHSILKQRILSLATHAVHIKRVHGE